MTYNPEFHHRRSIRLKGHDYSRAGAYFITICAWNRECLFGEIKNGEMLLNEYGEIAMKYWDVIPGNFGNVGCDEFVVMPNHIHGIIILSNVGAQFIAPFQKTMAKNPDEKNPDEKNQGAINHAPTVGEIVRSFKARCTHMINDIRKTPGGPVWQRNFHEHIIRDEKELNTIREYIRYNPLKWDGDKENPDMKGNSSFETNPHTMPSMLKIRSHI